MLEPPLIRADDRLEQMHGAPAHHLEAALVKEVDDDRDRQGARAGQQRGIEKVHARAARRPR